MKNKTFSQVLSLLLVFVLILGNTPIGQILAFAAGDTGSVQSLEIIAFEELAPEIEVQRVPSGTDESELNLPEIIMATVNLGSDDTQTTTDSAIDFITMDIPVPVTWTSSPLYDGDNDGEYIFIPLIENFAISAEPPIITVIVGETTGNVITDFTELPEEIRWQNTMTPGFPETVEGIIGGATAQIPVTWEADHHYEADYPQRGLYVFTAVLSDGYEVASGTELPLITVYIPQNAGRMMRMAGSGTTESPLEIYTASQLAEIAVLVNSKLGGLERFLFNNADSTVYLKLMNDIDLSGYQGGEGWMPIGTDSYPFKGTFDGNNKVITGLKINHSDTECQGLFGYISGGTVRNLGVININIQGGLNVGGVAGYLENSGIIENCYSTGTISSEIPFCYVGGVVGTSYATVRNCYSTCSISAATSSSSCTVGGVAGRSYGSIVNCYSSGSVNATALYGCCVGGVVGIIVGATVNNCYSTGSVSGTGGVGYVGGVIGFDYGSSVIKCCVALNSSISFSGTGDGYVGRVMGLSDESSFSSNYAFSGIPGSWNDKAHNKKNGADKTAESLVQSTFWKSTTNWNNSPWDEDIWNIENHKLPTLKGLSGQDGAIPAHINAKEFAGMGTSENPYLIKTAEDLARLAELVNSDNEAVRNAYNSKYYRLENNIDLSDYQSGEGWTPISVSSSFKGTFDGNNKVISGLKINRPDNDNQGLFGNIYDGTVKNLGVTNIDITGKAYVGGVAAYIYYNGNVEYCYTTGNVTATGTDSIYCGGVAGYVSLGTIQNCYSACDISTSNNRTGGIVGYINNGTVKNCYSTGDINSGGSELGGVAGYLSGSTVENCYTTGIISSTTGATVGGIAGYVNSSSTIKNCAALNPSVSGSKGAQFYVGRIAGLVNNGCTLSDNYSFSGMTVKGDGSDKDITSDASGADGGSKNKNDIKAADFFENLFSNDPTWQYATGRLPVLKDLAGQDDTLPLHISGLYFTGSGTSESPYLIMTAADLALLAELVNSDNADTRNNFNSKYYKLENDIDLSGYQTGEGWIPIGTYIDASNNKPFSGHFDGNGKVITGLYINRPDSDYQGLFGYLYGGTVKNLGVINVDIQCGSYVGAVAGRILNNSLIENCYSTGSINAGYYVGGLVGLMSSGTVRKCYSGCNVSGEINLCDVGGVVGSSGSGTTVENCYSTGNVSGIDPISNASQCRVGGVVGSSLGTIRNCYSTGNVSGHVEGTDNDSAIWVGGVVGYSGTTVEYCYSTGNVSGTTGGGESWCYVGGVAGSSGGTAKNCTALNASVIGSTTVITKCFIGRVVGESTGTLSSNYAVNHIAGIWNNEGLNAIDGADMTLQDLYDESFWTASENWSDGVWSDSIWTFSDNNLPKLTGLAGQTDDGGLHLILRDIQYATVTKNSDSFTYNGSLQQPVLTVVFNGETLEKDTDYTVAIISSDGEGTSAGTNIGTVTMEINGIGNFIGTKNNITYTIERKEVTVTPRAGQGKTYGQDEPALTYDLDYEIESGVISGAPFRESGENVGTYAISLGTLSAGSNYELTLDPTIKYFTIEKRAINLTADNITVEKGTELSDVTLTYSVENLPEGKTASDALSEAPVLACPTYDGNIPGSYPINITGGTATDNYIITARNNGTLAVTDTTTYYAVTFDPNGGTRTGGGELTQTVAEGGAATAPTVIRSGYTFTGWDSTFDNITSDLTVTALWQEIRNDSGSPSAGGNTPTEPVAQIKNGDITTNTNLQQLVSENKTLTHFSLYVVGVQSEPWVNPFKDVSETNWFYGAVEYANRKGLFVGTAEDIFSPEMPMTRAMFWTVLFRLDGQRAEDNEFEAARIWAMEKGLTDGNAPEKPITREQMVTILWRYAGSTKVDAESVNFIDLDNVAGYAVDAMKWAVKNGIIVGNKDYLMPKDDATRAQVAAVLQRFAKMEK